MTKLQAEFLHNSRV